MSTLQHIRANGITQAVAVAGEGPALVLLHGLGWDHSLWARELTAYAGRYRVIAPDLRGHGWTDKPDAPYSIAQYAADIAGLLDTLGVTRAAVLGFSLGGAILMRLAADRPDLVGAAVFACCGAGSTAQGEAGTEAMLDRAAGLGARRFAEEQAETVWSPAWARAHPERVAAFIGWRASMDQAALARAFRSGYGTDHWGLLPGIAVPSLVLAADQDSFCDVPILRRIAAALPDAEFALITGSGHQISIEQPEQFDRALLPFLDRAWPAKAGAAA